MVHSSNQGRSLWLIVVLLLLTLACSAWASEKKGVGIANLTMPERIEALDVSWYYTWGALPVQGAPPDKFVPMLRSRAGSILDEQMKLIRSRGKVPVLLVFNEPNADSGDSMSVEAILDLWPRISELADQLVSPAPSGSRATWFAEFYGGMKDRGLDVDYTAIHLYTPPDPELFLKKVDAIFKSFGKPIWITEFAVRDPLARRNPGAKNRYSESEVLNFMKVVLPELERRPYVVRYAWFEGGNYDATNEYVRTSRLFETDGRLTPLGRYYADFEWPPKNNAD